MIGNCGLRSTNWRTHPAAHRIGESEEADETRAAPARNLFPGGADFRTMRNT
jgi:hypothetical protein